MSLTTGTKRWLVDGLGSQAAADEIDAALVYGGTVYYVSSVTGSDQANGTSWQTPFATFAYALTQVTASQGDIIVLMPGHAETTTAVAWNVAGIRVVGVGFGRNRPTITATTAASDLIDVTAANGQLWNVRLVGAASGVTALLDGSSAATDFELHDCELVSAATPANLITWSGQRPIIEDLTVTQSANGADYVVVFEAGVDGFIFRRWDVLCPSGLDNGLISSGGFSHVGYVIDNITAVGLDSLVVNFISSTGAKADGFFGSGKLVYSAAVTSIEDGVAAATAKGMAFGFEVQAIDATGKRAGHIPLATAS